MSGPGRTIHTWFLSFLNPCGFALEHIGHVLRSPLLLLARTFSYPGVAIIVWQFQDKNVIGIQRICLDIYLQDEEN